MQFVEGESLEDRVQREVLARLQGQDVNLVKECPACGACYDSVVEACSEDGAELALSVPVERTIRGRYRLDRVRQLSRPLVVGK